MKLLINYTPSSIKSILEHILIQLIILKLFGLISISWFLVLAPFWIPTFFTFILSLLVWAFKL